MPEPDNPPISSIPGQTRRHLVIVFSDISNSTTLSAGMEPEDYVGLLDRLRTVASEIILRHGGSILRIDGDGFIFVFGIPEFQDHATRHAVEACLELHQQVAGLTPDLSVKLHTGIHAGIVLLRPGDISRGKYEILGEPTNITARLCDLAGDDEILISQDALGANRHLFEISEPRSVTLIPGRPPVHIHTVEGRKARADASERGIMTNGPPFVGRNAEMIWLNRSLVDAGAPIAVRIIAAEAGLGKTRLLSEFLRQAAVKGCGVHIGRCDAYMGAPALQPVAELTASVLRAVRQADLQKEIPPEAVDRLGPLAAGRPVDLSETAINALANDLANILNLLSGTKRTLLFIDDWHWADNASKALIGKLVTRSLPGITVLLTTRRADAFQSERVSTSHLHLPPLTKDASAQMIAALAPRLDPFLKRQIIEHAGGNPLFTEEICHSASLDPSVFKPDDRDVWLRTFVNQRFMRLPAPLATILKAAAIIGPVVSTGLLDKVVEGGVSREETDQLREADFLFPGQLEGLLRFKHGLTREAIYALIDLNERRQIHGRVADSLKALSTTRSAPDDDGQIAYHSLNCGRLNAALDYAVRAGQAALKQSALDRAQFYFHIALQASAQLPDYDPSAREALKYYGRACIVDPSWEQIDVLERGIDVAIRYQDIESIAWGRYWLASILYGLGEPKRALAQFMLSRRAAHEAHDQALLSQIETSLGQVHAAACEYTNAFHHLDSAIQRKREASPARRPSVSLAYALSCKAFAYGDMGAFDEAFRLFDDALAVMGHTNHEVCLSILGHRSAVHLWKGEFEKTLEMSGEVLGMSDRMRSRYHYSMSHVLIGAAEYYLGAGSPALQKIETAANWMIAGSSQQYISLAWGYLADGHAHNGDLQAARRCAARAIQRARKGDRLGETIAYRALAKLPQTGKRNDLRRYYLSQARNSAQRRGSKRELELTVYLESKLRGLNPQSALTALRDMGIEVERLIPHAQD